MQATFQNEAEKMISDLNMVYGKNGVKSVLQSFGINCKKIKSICKNFNQYANLEEVYKTEMQAIKKNYGHPANFSYAKFTPVQKTLKNGKIVIDYYPKTLTINQG